MSGTQIISKIPRNAVRRITLGLWKTGRDETVIFILKIGRELHYFIHRKP